MHETGKNRKIAKKTLFFAVFVISICVTYSAVSSLVKSCEDLHVWVHQWGFSGALLFFLSASILIFFCIPRTVIVLVAGVFWGVSGGSALSLLASMAGAVLSFQFSRSLYREPAEKFLKQRKWFFQLEEMARKHGRGFVFLSRITHIFHFGAVNFACGILEVSFSDYLWGTFWGIVPGTLIGCYAADLVGCGILEGKFPADMKWKLFVISTMAAVPVFISLWKKK